MSTRVGSSAALVPNFVTRVELEGRLVGRFVPTGPNRWDELELERVEDGPVLEVKAGETIQLEPLGARPELRFRLRRHREVVVLRWLPADRDRTALATGRWGERESEGATFLERVLGTGPEDDPRDDMLEYFVDVLAEPFEADKGLGAAAMIAKLLRSPGGGGHGG